MQNIAQFDQYVRPILLSITKEHNPRCPFAIKEANIIPANDAHLPKRLIVRAKNLLVPTHTRCDGDHLRFAIDFLRDFYWDENFTGASERIYISRAKSTRRFLKNDSELRALLEQKYGFKTLIMEEISFKDKVNFMGRAKVLLSVDGTSTLNYCYMKGGKAIALRAKTMAEYPVHSVFGVEFLPIICEMTDLNDDWFGSNLIADLDYVEQKLGEYGVERVR